MCQALKLTGIITRRPISQLLQDQIDKLGREEQ